MNPRPILICYDGSENSKQAVTRAADLFPDQPAIVLHVWEPLKDAASVPPVPGLYGMLEAGLEEMDKIGDEVSARTAAEGAEQAKAAGLAAEVARDRDVPAIVVGQRGIGGAERTLLGSVSTAVVHHADRPVVVVPAERAADC
jgi:nucleotide-binding universal stress UspA family protein